MRARSVVVVVPLGRPVMLGNVLENFNRQRFDRRSLVIVENGPAVGACKAAGFAPDAVLTSAPSPGQARNTGIEWVRKHGGGFFACFDDDDYYGPEYLIEAVKHSELAEVIGKSRVYVETMAGTLRLFEQTGENRLTTYAAGPTLSGWSESAVPFSAARCAEDCQWCENMSRSGARLYATSRFNFMQRRHAAPGHAHTWRVTDDQMAQATLHPVHDVGPVDLDVVNGHKPEPFRRLVPKRERCPEDHPDWKPTRLSFTQDELAALLRS